MGLRNFTAIGTIAAGIATAVINPASAATETYVFDETHTDILFAVSHLGFSKTWGRFNSSNGTVMIDPDALESSTVEIVIDATSIDTNHEERDDHLRGKDFFDVETYPTISYKSTSVEQTGDKTATVTGDLTMHGVTRPVALDVTLNNVGPNPFDKEKTVAGFSASATILRSDFGMSFGVPVLGDEVQMVFEIDAIKQP